MWYFAWILGVLLACSFGLINAMWLEMNENFDRDIHHRMYAPLPCNATCHSQPVQNLKL